MRTPYALAATALLAAACSLPAAAPETTVEPAAAGGWSYAGPTAPAFWSSLGYPQCTGPRQSPVNLPALPFAAPLRVSVTYPVTYPGHLANNGHTVGLLLPNTTAALHVADSTFTFKEMHFHVPAEHTVQGGRAAAEIHTVHTERGGDAAVLTTFVRAGDHNPAWEALIANLPGNKDDSHPLSSVNLTALLGLQHLPREAVYSYAGSLTTPECTPRVHFIIRQEPIVLSTAQIEALASAFPRNVRPVQTGTTSRIILHRGGS